MRRGKRHLRNHQTFKGTITLNFGRVETKLHVIDLRPETMEMLAQDMDRITHLVSEKVEDARAMANAIAKGFGEAEKERKDKEWKEKLARIPALFQSLLRRSLEERE